MKVRVVMTLEVDPAEWAEYYGIDKATVREDVKGYVDVCLSDSGAGQAGLFKYGTTSS